MSKFNVKGYLAEFLGTLMLVLVGSMGATQGGFPGAIAFGLTLAIGIYMFGSISGGHFNPVVSLVMAIRKRITWLNFLFYVIVQILGAFVGALIFGSFFGLNSIGLVTTNYFGANSDLFASLIAREIVLTAIFLLSILFVTSQKNISKIAPMIIGLTFGILLLAGESLNPARTMGPALASLLGESGNALSNAWIGLFPILGGLLALGIFELIKILPPRGNEVCDGECCEEEHKHDDHKGKCGGHGKGKGRCKDKEGHDHCKCNEEKDNTDNCTCEEGQCKCTPENNCGCIK